MYCLFNRDPYNSLWTIPIKVGSILPYITLNTPGFFHCSFNLNASWRKFETPRPPQLILRSGNPQMSLKKKDKDFWTWWFKVTFLGWLGDLLERLSDLQLGDEKGTLNQLEHVHFKNLLQRFEYSLVTLVLQSTLLFECILGRFLGSKKYLLKRYLEH